MKNGFWRGFWSGLSMIHLLVWLLYWLGDGLSRLMNLWKPLGRLHPVYNKCMVWSSRLQEIFDVPGPWRKTNKDTA